MAKQQTKLDKLKQLMAQGNYHDALRLAASWPRLGVHKVRITRAWAAMQNPQTYLEMEQNPQTLVADGIAAIKERYEL